jgi:Leucine-rich repeat (LRR) protein
MVGLAPKLTTLALSRNALKALPEWLATFGSLKTLEVDGNALTSFPAGFAGHKRLEKLTLSQVRLFWSSSKPFRSPRCRIC